MGKILITGASNGIGLETAKILAKEGNQLTLVARNKEKLEAVMNDLPGTGHNLLVADLSRKDDIHHVADHMTDTHYDVLINNAGVGMYGRFEEMSLSEQISMINLNILCLTVLSYHFIKQARKGDRLINIASTLGSTSFAGAAVYAATKAFVINFSESLWWENKKKGVYVLGFCPGVTETNFHAASGGSQEMFPKFITQTSAQVAANIVQALKKQGKPKVVSGVPNKFMLSFHRLLSRKMVVNMMGSFSPLNT
jgi:uncharacterized protein